MLRWTNNGVLKIVGPAPPPPYYFFIPHDLTLMEDKNLICASDRENGRVQCFRTSDGSFVFQKYSSQTLGSRIFSAAYTPQAGEFIKNVFRLLSKYFQNFHESLLKTHQNYNQYAADVYLYFMQVHQYMNMPYVRKMV